MLFLSYVIVTTININLGVRIPMRSVTVYNFKEGIRPRLRIGLVHKKVVNLITESHHDLDYYCRLLLDYK